jgi:hypothetical protein
MKFMANSILVVLIMTIFIMVFSNFILFFPWYLTLIYQTYNLSIQASGENYVTNLMVIDVKNDLKSRPIFNKMEEGDIKINMNDMELDGVMEPQYLQRGESFAVGIECSFPFEINVGETRFKRSVRVKFEVPTTGLKYYRELGY